MRQYSSTSYTREKASSRTSCRDSTAGSWLLSQTLPSLAGFRAGAACSISGPHKTQEISSLKPHQKPATVHETTTHHHKPPPAVQSGVGGADLVLLPGALLLGVWTLLSHQQHLHVRHGNWRKSRSHEHPLSSPLPQVPGTQSPSMGAHSHLPLGQSVSRSFPSLFFLPSPTFFQQALDGDRVHPLLHIPVVQHLVVG